MVITSFFCQRLVPFFDKNYNKYQGTSVNNINLPIKSQSKKTALVRRNFISSKIT